MRRFGAFGLIEDSGIGLLDHLLAKIDADQVILEYVVVEHVLGGFAEVNDAFGQGRRRMPKAMFWHTG